MNYGMPQDIAQAYTLYKTFFDDLTDYMQTDVKEWLEELRRAINTWKAGGAEPDWNQFRQWSNEINQDDGMPRLFAEDMEGET
jgi:hypothetical protein